MITDKLYETSYSVLDWMSKNGHVSRNGVYAPVGTDLKGKKIWAVTCCPSQDMNNLIDALNKGDEEKIKGLLLLFRSYYPKAF